MPDGYRTCSGVPSGIIPAYNWVRDEIKAQVAGLKKTFGGKKPSIPDYLQWANGNQRYKDADYFQFSKGVEGCGTWPDKTKPGCGHSVTLCGKCVRNAILGNIMYGYIGRIAGFTKEELIKGATDTKTTWGFTVDKYDEASYGLGYDLQGKFPNHEGTLEDLCSALDGLLKENGMLSRKAMIRAGITTCPPASHVRKIPKKRGMGAVKVQDGGRSC